MNIWFFFVGVVNAFVLFCFWLAYQLMRAQKNCAEAIRVALEWQATAEKYRDLYNNLAGIEQWTPGHEDKSWLKGR